MPTRRTRHAWTSAATLAYGAMAAGCALTHAVREGEGGADAAHPRNDSSVPPIDGGCPAGQSFCRTGCFDVTSDPHACSTSCTDCTTLPGVNAAAVTCVSAACVLTGSACMPGRADCDGNVVNGCEADVTTAARCGGCTTTCAGATPMCVGTGSGPSTVYACGSSCPAGTTLCPPSTCADLMTSFDHCGGCNTPCMAPMLGMASCVGGTCRPTCVAGFHYCSGVGMCLSDSSPLSCGTSCTPCTAPPNATPACVGASCDFTCNPGYTRMGGTCTPVASSNCGNRMIDGAETCDDGNTTAGDGCSATCTVEADPSSSCPGPHLRVGGTGTAGWQLYRGDTSGGSNSFRCNLGGGAGAPDRVYEIESAFAGTMRVELRPAAGFDAVLQIRTMCGNSMSERACLDMAGAGGTEGTNVSVLVGSRFYVIVDGFMTMSGAYTVAFQSM